MRLQFVGRFGRLSVLGASIFLITSCSSTPKPNLSASKPGENRTEIDQLWEDTTRERADELMSEAQDLASVGKYKQALDRVDDAICEVLAIPPGYKIEPRYIDFLANLLNEAWDLEEAQRIEASLGSLLEGMQAAQEYVELPTIEGVREELVDEALADEGPLPQSDFPLVLNSTVESYLEALTDPGEFHQRIETGLQRSGAFLPMIRTKLAQAGLPEDLGYLPLIESAFSLTAYSRARAHGMWQFISSTGRHYGLDIGTLVDERRDPVLSTDAAISYLKDLHRQFDDWYLALAGYNSGAGNVRRAIRRSGSRDFWVLRRYLPRETRNYVPAFIAAVIIAKQPTKYGFSISTEQPWQYETVEIPDALDLQFLASNVGISLDVLRDLNPAIRRDLTPAKTNTQLRVPPGKADTARQVLVSTPRADWAPRMLHSVRSGESLYTIAQKYGSNVSAIRQANGLRGSLIRPGQTLMVPRLEGNAKVARIKPARTSTDGFYIVQNGDTLWDIARTFSVSVESLCSANGLSRNQTIQPGQRIVVSEQRSSSKPIQLSGKTYSVRSGDTLYDIARNYGVSTSELRRANGLSNSRIYPGAILKIPTSTKGSGPLRTTLAEGTYRVQRGDTLYDIARRFGTSVSALRSVNGLRSSRIYPGDVLRIPSIQAKG